MTITITASAGYASTLLSAFDSALFSAGVSNYNIIQLSSIIPPGSKIKKVKKYKTPKADFGKRLYVVKAEMRSNEAGKFIAAGVGWYQLEDGKGFFVEHEIIGETKVAVESEINFRIINSLRDMCTFRRIPFKAAKVHSMLSIMQVKSHPSCVLVLAVFKAEPWDALPS